MKDKKLLSPNIYLDISNLITNVLKQHWALLTRRACGLVTRQIWFEHSTGKTTRA